MTLAGRGRFLSGALLVLIPTLVVPRAAFSPRQAHAASRTLLANRLAVRIARIFPPVVAAHRAAARAFCILRFGWRKTPKNEHQGRREEYPETHHSGSLCQSLAPFPMALDSEQNRI